MFSVEEAKRIKNKTKIFNPTFLTSVFPSSLKVVFRLFGDTFISSKILELLEFWRKQIIVIVLDKTDIEVNVAELSEKLNSHPSFLSFSSISWSNFIH